MSPADFQRMDAGGIGTVRTTLSWADIDSTSASGDENWSAFDAFVLAAAGTDIDVQPFVFGTPPWVARGLDGVSCSPARCGLYAPRSARALAAFRAFVGAAVDRYGPGGELWSLHPEVQANPIRVGQILNEQNSRSFCLPKPSPQRYAGVLAAANSAIGSRDRGAEIVIGGMAELAGSSRAIRGSEYLERLYDVAAVKRSFDAVAPHPYGATIAKVESQVERFREVMVDARDGGASIYVTEVGAGSAPGGNPLNRGPAGQATLLKRVYRALAAKRNRFNIEAVDWFSWRDSTTSICAWCSSSGLLTADGAAKPGYRRLTALTGGSVN